MQLKKLDVNKATGLDNVSSRLLKAGAVALSTPLTHIFNHCVSLRTGIVPSKWEISRVTPLFKDGPRTAVGNYRSVIPVVMKLLERIFHDQFHDYLTYYNMF